MLSRLMCNDLIRANHGESMRDFPDARPYPLLRTAGLDGTVRIWDAPHFPPQGKRRE
jgi:hypothetical protein